MRKTLVVVVALTLLAAACGDDDASPDVNDAWARASAMVQNAGALYMTIEGGSDDAVVTGVSVPTDVAAMAMLHETAMDDDGAMSMSMVPQIEVPAGETVSLEPGGFHVMMMDLAAPLEVGQTFDVTVMFGDGTEVAVTAEVRDE
jgi:copper(I)-binding protein